MQALIYRSTGSWYTVKTITTGETFQARIKGVLKLDGDITSTNPIAVGDIVDIVPEEGDANAKNAMITGIGDRRNYIVRSSPHKKGNAKHIVAANLDQAMLICTVKEPRTSNGFMDRFLVTAAAYHIPVVLVFNKRDIYKEKEIDRFAELAALYEDIGYTVKLVSAATGGGIDELETMMKDKTTLMSGHSGVGKSSLINRLLPGLDLRTKAVSGWSGKGLHTTTYAEMYDLPQGGRLIDTPGVREFGIVDIAKPELSHYFLEMQPYLTQCQFNNCLHINEPGCAVKAAVEEGEIDMERYVSYATILESIQEESY
ncbi:MULTISPECIES: ribosome small subunit-dependent GTPase A [unclassified Chitinophaga]|uniref:ribosome small subunit-dependent GTPase A n=1 Tax=unclassified Chitinophaga TaxID=2619133 RepID=UPI0009C8FD24|nr:MULTISPECIES: ribosome small subunit-dependent GTPase A [unclassified Chitinophaga]OMP75046.1 ribosome small subunit-dependent GTPase A [[Flexibacter] sp. ATCC 35208]WPV68390.1 ribosome small subunit-dependent GTPase A [Chitinophaga sp. LS1]